MDDAQRSKELSWGVCVCVVFFFLLPKTLEGKKTRKKKKKKRERGVDQDNRSRTCHWDQVVDGSP